MDPITRAMQQFADDLAAFRRAHPARLVPLVAAEDDRSRVVEALRFCENAPENRRPFVIFEEPFDGPQAYFDALADRIADDYDLVRRGAAEEGVILPPLVPAGEAPALERAVPAAGQAAELLGDGLDGLVVALLPEHVEDTGRWRESIRTLLDTRVPPRVDLAVFAPPSGPLAGMLGDECVCLDVAPGDVLGFLSAARDSTAKLDALLIKAAEAEAAGRTGDAERLYRDAHALCQAERPGEQHAPVSIALARADETQVAAGGESAGPRLPFSSAVPEPSRDDERPPALSIERYAALCVDLIETPNAHELVLARYRIGAAEKLSLDVYWTQKMAEDTTIWLVWDRACTQHRAGLGAAEPAGDTSQGAHDDF